MRLLIVEDDNRVAAALGGVMTRHGFTVFRAATGAEAVRRVSDADVILLDLGLPDMDGFEVCRQIRAAADVPIIVVTARSELNARVHGLHMGADDYMVKPVNGAELVARIHAVTRRASRRGSEGTGGATTSGDVTIGELLVSPATRQVVVGGEPVTLTRKEFDLLRTLVTEPGLVYRREQLIAEVWGTGDPATFRTLEVHVASLRSKLGLPDLIETVRGVGYRVAAGKPEN